MRRIALVLLASVLAAPAIPAALAQGGQPPHAWLFGTWTGGLFPVPQSFTLQACLAQPVVIFTRDLVMRATLTEQTMAQREIETARVVPSGIEFHFTAAGGGAPLLGLSGGRAAGFGCEATNVLHVQRRGEHEIAFPGCADFPNPLVRCH